MQVRRRGEEEEGGEVEEKFSFCACAELLQEKKLQIGFKKTKQVLFLCEGVPGPARPGPARPSLSPA
ncbi:hypothetical protein EYF80_038273 [Liparis tanakae]|uniref:Uncharacterized protein n=1 Tax=Liparis tanakae TaxID=230148 RepID=A0A4Z2GFU4_9TELE|nr:hypothetical protein EYF80_038273 [Liparis tanakae]